VIGAYCIDTIVLRKDKGMDEWQEPYTAEDETIKGFIEYSEHRIENAMGQFVISLAKVYLRPMVIITTGFASRAANTISYKDKLVFDGLEHAIIRINKARDFSVRAMEIYVS